MVSSIRSFAGVIIIMMLAGCNKGSKIQDQETPSTHGIIPLPLQGDFLPGSLTIDSNIIVAGDDIFSVAKSTAETALSEALTERTGDNADTINKTVIRFIPDNSLTDEGYRISISDKGIKIYARTGHGAFYGSESLNQMIWTVSEGKKQRTFELKNIIINDAPKYSWRGFHMDLSRHFFTREYIMKVIDQLAYYKINKLHLHLTDDQGWRIQIDQFPLLTTEGGWRFFNAMDSACLKKSASDSKYIIDSRFISSSGGSPVYGGFFTKQDLQEIIAYAGSHFIEVIPEIDMPGHMSAAIKAYPFLSCTGSTGWGNEFSNPVCPCNQEVMDFCHRVYDEVADLFPSKYVHIGCDEVEKGTWEGSAECQAFMLQNNIHSVNEIQSWFVSDMQKYLEAKGKTVIVWDDVIDGAADNNLVMMYWRDWVTDSPDRCAANGNDIILTPWSPFYISGDHTDKTLQDLYDYDPSRVLSATVNAKVIGLQSCLWTEYIPSEAMFEYLVYPRMQALSEVAWGAGRDWTTFKIRLQPHLKYMTSKSIKYRRPGWAG
jgi:hexosaminidase